MTSEHKLRVWQDTCLNTGNEYVLELDYSQFELENIGMEIEGNNLVIRSSQRYVLPEGCAPENVRSKLSSNGILRIEAPKKILDIKGDKRVVPIQIEGKQSNTKFKEQKHNIKKVKNEAKIETPIEKPNETPKVVPIIKTLKSNDDNKEEEELNTRISDMSLVNELQCNICQKILSSKGNLNRHMKTKHQQNK